MIHFIIEFKMIKKKQSKGAPVRWSKGVELRLEPGVKDT